VLTSLSRFAYNMLNYCPCLRATPRVLPKRRFAKTITRAFALPSTIHSQLRCFVDTFNAFRICALMVVSRHSADVPTLAPLNIIEEG
jgi:hypothetical protein